MIFTANSLHPPIYFTRKKFNNHPINPQNETISSDNYNKTDLTGSGLRALVLVFLISISKIKRTESHF